MLGSSLGSRLESLAEHSLERPVIVAVVDVEVCPVGSFRPFGRGDRDSH